MVKAVDKDKDRRYVCVKCGKKFRGASGLWYHKQTHGYKPKTRSKCASKRRKTTRPKQPTVIRRHRVINSGIVSKLVGLPPSDDVKQPAGNSKKIHGSERTDDLKWLDAVFERDARKAALQCFADWDLPVSVEPCNGPSCTWLHPLPVCESQT